MGDLRAPLLTVDRDYERPTLDRRVVARLGRPLLARGDTPTDTRSGTDAHGDAAQPHPAAHRLRSVSRAALQCQVQILLRHLGLLIDQYLRLAQRESERLRLLGLVRAMIGDARACFAAAAMLKAAGDAERDAEHGRCVSDLDAFLRTLSGSAPLLTRDVIHAIDSLVVHCAILDAEQHDAASEWSQPVQETTI